MRGYDRTDRLNELLIRTLRHEEPVVELFGVYEEALGRLEIEHDLESTLRVFEKRLLRELGYELSFEVDSSTGNKLMEDVEYEFVRGAGFQPAFKSQVGIARVQRRFGFVPMRSNSILVLHQIGVQGIAIFTAGHNS